MSSSTPRDIIQISLGSSANAVTAHALNLQGLAATNGSSPDGYDDDYSNTNKSTCDPQTTHSLERDHWVPRVMLVDEPTRFFVSPQVSSAQLSLAAASRSFAIEPLDPSVGFSHAQPHSSWSSQFLQASSTLAYSSHSRYYHKEPQVTYRANPANPRHVVWDDDDEMNDEMEEAPHEKQARVQRERGVWHRNTEEPLQEQLSTIAAEQLPTSPPQHWMEYWMPPYSQKSLIALPYSQQSQMVAHWDSYTDNNNDKLLDEWKEDVLFEQLRHLLEDCDACQGVTITTQGHGIYAGLTTALLQELQEEAKSVGRIVFHITNPASTTDAEDPEASQTKDHPAEDDVPGWQPAHVERLRSKMSSGLALHDFSQNANLVVPLKLAQDKPLFQASAELAMALEAATLPIRLNAARDPRYQIGLLNAPFFGQGGGDSQWGTTAQHLSMSEFLMCLQPSHQYSVCELDVLHPPQPPLEAPNAKLWDAFKAGTSVERDYRMRDSGRDGSRSRPTNVDPGAWMQDVKHGGLLSSMSPIGDKGTDRSVHHHFTLSTSVRPILQDEMSNYLTCLVQGMGVRYRPERSCCTVLDQTVGRLTQAGGYGAGAYWKSLIDTKTPVVSVLGNTTRVYPYLNQVGTDMKTVLGARYRGYYQRDVLNGVLPEAEDCQESLANCFDLRDVYHPPTSSGLVQDDDCDIDY